MRPEGRSIQHQVHVYNSFRIASVTSVVVDLPPISGVRYLPSRRTASTAALILVAASGKPRDWRRSEADLRDQQAASAVGLKTYRMEAMGLAMFLPSISGAEPCTLVSQLNRSLQCMRVVELRVGSRTHGSPITKLSPALIDGTRPRDPTRAAAPSLH